MVLWKDLWNIHYLWKAGGAVETLRVVAGGVADTTAAHPSSDPYVYVRARVAVYDAPTAAPRVVDVEPTDVSSYIEAIASTVYSLAKEQGGDLPYTVIREVAENFIHADFAEPVISVLDRGTTIRFSDCGPGIQNKEKALLPGFTTATGDMKAFIRGVGSGLPLVKDYLSYAGGSIVIDDNLDAGSVVTISSGQSSAPSPSIESRSANRGALGLSEDPARQIGSAPEASTIDTDEALPSVGPYLTTRQKQVLALVMESGSVGPSLVSKELRIGISTAYRDLASLEDLGLIEADGGKRSLTPSGLAYLDKLITGLH